MERNFDLTDFMIFEIEEPSGRGLLFVIKKTSVFSGLLFFGKLVIIIAAVLQFILLWEEVKNKINVKNPPTKNCNTMVVPVEIIFKLDQYWI